MRTSVRSDARTSTLALSAGVGFVLAVCGSNAVTPLLPRYQDEHGFSSLATAVLFSMYFAALLTVLIASTRGPIVRNARIVLPAAVAVGLTGDLLQIVGATVPALLFPGRFLTGTAVALATGSAAAIMVATRGEAGRAFIGTGSLLGAGGGLAAAIGIVVALPGQLVTVYAVHAVAMALCLVAILVSLRLSPEVLATRAPAASASTPGRDESDDSERGAALIASQTRPGPPRRDLGAYVLGAMAWAIGALAVGALPATILTAGVADSLLVAMCAGGACLFTSMIASLLGVGLRWAATTSYAIAFMAGGWSVATVGLLAGRIDVIVVGTMLGGGGQAAGYRVGLARLTAGLSAIRQGQVAAGYSATAYAGAGVFVILDGALASLLGALGGAGASAVVFVVGCALAWGLRGWVGRGSVSADTGKNAGEEAGQRVSATSRDLLN